MLKVNGYQSRPCLKMKKKKRKQMKIVNGNSICSVQSKRSLSHQRSLPPKYANHQHHHPDLLSTCETFLFLRHVQNANYCFLVVLTAPLPLRYRCVAKEPNQITVIYIFIKTPVKSRINCCYYIQCFSKYLVGTSAPLHRSLQES